MSKSVENNGFRSWFHPFPVQERNTLIFVLDFETRSFWEENDNQFEDNFDNDMEINNQRRVNGVMVYFLDENGEKKRAFLRHEPYFYLLLDESTKEPFRKIKYRLEEIGKDKIIRIEKVKAYDAADLTFLKAKDFIKVTVDHPGTVPKIRDKCEKITGIKEWREADVLFHHRTAIDHDLRVGRWYKARIIRGEIKKLEMIKDKAPAQLKILAYDIETTFAEGHSLHPKKDHVTMVSLFTGKNNYLIVNKKSFDTSNVRSMDIVLRPKDEQHSKPWVDYEFYDSRDFNKKTIERHFVEVIKVDDEEQLIRTFLQIIKEEKPDILADFNGDRFDIPFLVERGKLYGISIEKETGFKLNLSFNSGQQKNGETDIFKETDNVSGAGIIHLDAYLFNDKYSYLPKKDLALKASVKKKLKILPIEREALFAIKEDPAGATAYAACDGYITWKYVRDIILDFYLSLGHLFPVNASELFTKRAGSLDDLLVDSVSHKNNIIAKKRLSQLTNHSLTPSINVQTLTYTGGLVEARRPGIWRSDLLYKVEVDKTAIKELNDIVATIIRNESKKIAKKSVKDELEKMIFRDFPKADINIDKNLNDIINDIDDKVFSGEISEEERRLLNSLKTRIEELNNFEITGIDEEIEKITNQIKTVLTHEGEGQLVGLHVDVTSMYPSQIRQFKLQPSGIVDKERCLSCPYAEKDYSCRFSGKWIVRLAANRPCQLEVDGKCDCNVDNKSSCKKYIPVGGKSRVQEVYTYDGKKTSAYRLSKNGILSPVSLSSTYFSIGVSDSKDSFEIVQEWLDDVLDGSTEIIADLENNVFNLFEDVNKKIKKPKNVFMTLDARQKLITILLSVNSYVCQKAYDHMSKIMEDFFQTRVFHKKEAKRLKKQIEQLGTIDDRELIEKLIKKQKFHDATQLGLKVPLNSVYGLLGMKGGVRNASTPCAGITTRLSAQLIHWASMELEKFGMVTELDTDGIWLWVPKGFPLTFNVNLEIHGQQKGDKITVTLVDKILNHKVYHFSRNDNYWTNNGETMKRTPKALIGFEQDPVKGHYDFQLVLGKKKYIVYSYSEKTGWKEEELTGLETKRADFSKLQKHFQEQIIQAFLKDFSPENPKPLHQLYLNAMNKAEEIKQQIKHGKIDFDNLVKPKAIIKPIEEYSPNLPQIKAAKMLIEQGISVEPGTKIGLLQAKGKKVVPLELFSLDFSRIKKTLAKHKVCTLSFSMGQITSKEELYKIIDIQHYIDDLYGPGRIYERMIVNLMKKQGIGYIKTTQNTLENKFDFIDESEPLFSDKDRKQELVVIPVEDSKRRSNNTKKVTGKKKKKKVTVKTTIKKKEERTLLDIVGQKAITKKKSTKSSAKKKGVSTSKKNSKKAIDITVKKIKTETKKKAKKQKKKDIEKLVNSLSIKTEKEDSSKELTLDESSYEISAPSTNSEIEKSVINDVTEENNLDIMADIKISANDSAAEENTISVNDYIESENVLVNNSGANGHNNGNGTVLLNYHNGHLNGNNGQISKEPVMIPPIEGYGCYICSVCGRKIEPNELTDEGCMFCGGKLEYCLD